MPGLDVVRGIAIVAVLLYHGLGTDALAMQHRLSAWQFATLSWFQVGSKGVHLFFVLSGFLITGILLDTRHNRQYYKTFYLRRVLRIVPAYVLMILVLKLTSVISWRFVLVCLVYLVNMSGLLRSEPEYGSFWSLSVEEQFYLVWPILIRKLRVRALFLLTLAMMAGTPVLRFGLLYGPASLRDIHYKTWAVGDFFAAGALLAILVRSPRMRWVLRPMAVGCIAAGGSLIVLAARIQGNAGAEAKLLQALYLSPWMLLCMGIVLAAFLFPAIGLWSDGKGLVFLGYISYGLYIVHSAVYEFTHRYWHLEAGNEEHGRLFGLIIARFLLEVALSIALAWISRSTFEQYFLRLKPRQAKTVENLSIAK